MIERFYVRKSAKYRDQNGTFNPYAEFPRPENLVLKIESTLDSCLLIEQVQVAEKFFSSVLQRAGREGYYNKKEIIESAAKLQVLVEKQARLIAKRTRNTV